MKKLLWEKEQELNDNIQKGIIQKKNKNMQLQINYTSSYILYFLSIQQSSVLSDLHLQPVLDVKQHLVVTRLPRDVHPHIAELILQVVDQGLQLSQLQAVAGLCLGHLALQGSFLHRREREREKNKEDTEV